MKTMFTLLSNAFSHNGLIPSKYTCDGEDIAVPLTWNNTPSGTQSFVLIVDDPDAPDPKAPQRTWIHWVLYNIPKEVIGFGEGGDVLVANGTHSTKPLEGLNDWNKIGYGGPCPPIGIHRYFHKLYALDCLLPPFSSPPTRAQLESAMEGHILAKAELIGKYQKVK